MVRNSFRGYLLDLASLASANPSPMFDRNKRDWDEEEKNGKEGLLSNVQFMIVGAFLGVLATVVYYQIARFWQQYNLSRINNRVIDLERAVPASSLEDPNKYIFGTEKAQ